MKVLSLVGHVALTLAVCAASPAVEPWFGAPIPASGEDGRADCGMTAARVFDAPIAGLERIGTLAVPKSADLPESSTGSIGFECLDRGLFDPDRCYDTLAAAGVKWARCQTMWSRCEKQKGVYDFTVLDGVVDNLTRRGIRPWFSVTFGNTLYMTNCFTGAAVGCVPTLYGEECRAAWCAYVRALARRYKGKVTHWEVWNEPNLPQFWQPSKPNADDYLALVKLTGSVIREEIPDAKIGGTTASPALNAWEKRFFEAGGAKAIDFWCGHAYTRVPERLRKQQRIASGSSDEADRLRQFGRLRCRPQGRARLHRRTRREARGHLAGRVRLPQLVSGRPLALVAEERLQGRLAEPGQPGEVAPAPVRHRPPRWHRA